MKFMVLSCLAGLCCSGLTVAIGAAAPAVWNPDDTGPAAADVAAAAARAKATHCTTPSCKAIIVINKLVDIALYEAGDANGVAGLDLRNRPPIAGRRLDRVLLNHRTLFALVCATGVKIVSRFRLGPGTDDMFVPMQLLVNAVDMDLHDHGHCAQDLVAALPKDPANDEVRFNAESLCDEGTENQRRPKSACAVLIKGLKAPA